MTIQEAHIALDIEVQKINSNAYANFLSEEKDYYLNKSQDQFIRTKFDHLSNRKRKGYDENQVRIDDLRAILRKPAFITEFTQDVRGRSITALPEDYMFEVAMEAKIDCDGAFDVVPVVVQSHEWIYQVQKHPFAKSSVQVVNAVIDRNSITLYEDDTFTLVGLGVDYISYPPRVDLSLNQGFALPDITHDKIVSDAAAMILEAVESQRFGTKTQLNQIIE
ncbi:MAG: hypothetical protein KI786_05735 [Mameliella sp.]|nr:hypothetical protein [Phaeodactylibacter sp.]